MKILTLIRAIKKVQKLKITDGILQYTLASNKTYNRLPKQTTERSDTLMSYIDILKTQKLSDSPRWVFLVQQPSMSPFSVGTSVLLCVYLKVTEDGDVCKFFAISMRIEGQQERPLQTHEAPHTRQVQTGRICEGCTHTHTHIKKKVKPFSNNRPPVSLMSWRPLSLQNISSQTDMNERLVHT